MAEGVNAEMIRALAEVNGIPIPEERLDLVLKQYQTYLELLSSLDAFMLSREAEPSVKFELPTGTPARDAR
jgi:hypothetical protein